jgi:hypothetical protein
MLKLPLQHPIPSIHYQDKRIILLIKNHVNFFLTFN